MNFTRIDHLTLGEHSHLSADDECYFLREYTARQGFEASDTNRIVLNLKKEMDRRGRPEWLYKEKAIKQAAAEIRTALTPQWLRAATIVPVPPHRVKSDPLYDDRMTQMATLIGSDVRELVVQIATLTSSHESNSRPSPRELRNNYRLDEALCTPAPGAIGVLDDMLTAGAHFRAIKDMLVERFPGVPVVGIFYARRIVPSAPAL